MKLALNRIIVMVLLSSLTLLSGCFSSTDEDTQIDTLYQSDVFSLQPAAAWTSLDSSEFGPDVPKQTLAAFTAPNATSDLLKTLTVISEPIAVRVESEVAYANANIGETIKNLINYEKIAIEESEISGQITKIHTFRGKLSLEEDMVLFVQTYLVQNQKGYILTGVLLNEASIEEIDEVKNMMKSFQFSQS